MGKISFFRLELFNQAVFGILAVCIIIKAVCGLIGSDSDIRYSHISVIDSIETERIIIRLADSIEMQNRQIIHLRNMLYDYENNEKPEMKKFRGNKNLIEGEMRTRDERGMRWNKDSIRKRLKGRRK